MAERLKQKHNRIEGGISGVSDYKLLSDAYNADGGFADGSYLEPHKRERVENYESRKAAAYFLNYLKPVVNSHVDPVFRSPAKRDWKGADTLFGKFMKDVDRCGTGMEAFIKEAAQEAKLQGVVFIVVDNERLNEPITVAVAAEKRKFPYAYFVTRDRVKKWKRDATGNLREFSFIEDDGDDSTQKKDLDIRERGWTEAEWYVKDRDGKIIDGAPNAIGRIPVIPMYGRKNRRVFMPRSEFYSCAKANGSIFNLCSKLDQIISDVTFPLLKYPRTDLSELTIGTGNAIGWDGTANAAGPSYIAPPSDPAKVIMEQIDRLIKEIYRMAVLSHVMGVEQKTSGIAKEWDFQQTNEILSACATACQETEIAVVELYKAYANATFEYTCQYPDNFGVKDKTAAVDNAGKALDLGVGGEFDKAVKKDVAAALFQDMPDEDYDAIIDEIDLTESPPRTAPILFPAGGTNNSAAGA